ncbi:cell division protein FtsQ/DivIB [Alkanindiges sp. WGS2144]|uniref:cell division protein FtsQ/DivIB n=1 Tax=Alkanindiges sp. WGS2144 TaxID=3366808 RepID=UPI00374FE6E3
MAELPISMRRKAAPVRTAKSTGKWERASWWGSWLLVALAVVLCGVGIWATLNTIRQAPAATVEVVGDLNTLQQQLLHNKLQPLVNEGFFTTDLEALRDEALELPWVDRVVVTRHWPNGIVIRATPRHPIARWGSGRLLSDSGHIFVEASYVDRRDLPLLHGPSIYSVQLMQQYRQINQWFAPLGMQLKELHLTDRMTWFMQFNTGMRVIVDQDQTLTKLQRLSQLGLTELKVQWPNIVAADLRYRNGLALQWKNAQPPKIVANKFVVEPVLADPVAGVALNHSLIKN